MQDLLDELLDNSKSSNEQKGFVFFNDESPEGYVSTIDFVKSLRKQKADQPERLSHLKKMFDLMAEYRNFNFEPTITKVDGVDMIYVGFRYGKYRPNLLILNECNLFAFVTNYGKGLIRNVPNFETLIKSISRT
jgi:hypothetical protein